MFAARGLLRAEPLQRVGILGAVGDLDLPGVSDLHGQRAALAFHLRAQIVAQGIAFAIGDRGDFVAAMVEHDFARIVLRLDIEHRFAGDRFVGEIQFEIQRDMGDPRDLRPREGLVVERVFTGQDRCHLGRGGRELGSRGAIGKRQRESQGG